MNSKGVLLDTGPIVALLSARDGSHARAERLFGDCEAPLRCCEAVVAEACHLMRRVHPEGPAAVVELGRKGVFEIALSLQGEWLSVERLMRKYASRPIGLADACLIRCAEVHQEARILTFDTDFTFYRWDRRKRFEIL